MSTAPAQGAAEHLQTKVTATKPALSPLLATHWCAPAIFKRFDRLRDRARMEPYPSLQGAPTPRRAATLACFVIRASYCGLRFPRPPPQAPRRPLPARP
jgi:hypothetical protein